MPKKLILYAAVALVIFAFYLGSRWFSAQKRKKEKELTDPTQMTPAKLTHSFTIENTPISDQIRNTLSAQGARLIEGKHSSLISYIGDAAAAKFDGMLKVDPREMPLRIIMVPDGDTLQVRLDEDFGFHMFMGVAKSAFNDKYKEAFTHYEEVIRSIA